MCLTGCPRCTHAAQILQLTRGPEDEAGPQGWPNHPFSDTHLSYPPPPPSRWMTLQPAGVSCAEGAPPPPPAPQALGPEPQRKSAAVSSREPCPARGLSPAWHHLSPGSDAGAALPRWVPTDLLHPPDHMGQTWDRRQIHHAGVWTQQSRLGVHPL